MQRNGEIIPFLYPIPLIYVKMQPSKNVLFTILFLVYKIWCSLNEDTNVALYVDLCCEFMTVM
jgi:hypothetical protein